MQTIIDVLLIVVLLAGTFVIPEIIMHFGRATNFWAEACGAAWAVVGSYLLGWHYYFSRRTVS